MVPVEIEVVVNMVRDECVVKNFVATYSIGYLSAYGSMIAPYEFNLLIQESGEL